MEFIPYVMFVLGFIFIIKGGDFFVDSATSIAKITRLPEVFIGATIVSFATTFPELMVSVVSSVNNYTSMAIGNSIGSIICNTGLVLGIYNIVRPTKIKSRIFNFKGIIVIIYLIILLFICINGTISRLNGLFFIGLLFVFFIFNILLLGYKRFQTPMDRYKIHIPNTQFIKILLQFIFGIGLILIGARLLVIYGVEIAQYLGVPNSVISLTLIAFGTSLPELATSISALIKGHSELSIGNVLGANILNITMVIGVSSIIRPIPVSAQTFYIDIPLALALNSLLILPGICSRKISRLQSVIIMVIYFIYIKMLF